MRASPFQTARLTDVRGLVKAGLKLDQRGNGFAVLCRLTERLNDWGVLGRAIKRLFDRHHIRVGGRLFEEPHHHVEGLVGVVEQHVLLFDRFEHVAAVVLNPFGNARRVRRPQKVRTAVEDQLFEVGHTEHTVHNHHFGFVNVQFVHDHVAQPVRRACGHLHPDDFTATTTFEGDLKFAHQIFGFFFDLKVAVAQHAERTVAFDLITREEAVDVQQKQFFERQEPIPVNCRQRDKAVDLMRHRQERPH